MSIFFDLTLRDNIGNQSFIRLNARKKVDFPQPEGPIIDVIAFDLIERLISFNAKITIAYF